MLVFNYEFRIINYESSLIFQAVLLVTILNFTSRSWVINGSVPGKAKIFPNSAITALVRVSRTNQVLTHPKEDLGPNTGA
jgi:hypothetical protein